MSNRLYHYVIRFVATTDQQQAEGWRCQAEDVDHAIEQFRDELSHDGMIIVAVEGPDTPPSFNTSL